MLQSGVEMRKRITLNIDVEALKKIDQARGMVPRSRWVEDICVKAIQKKNPGQERSEEVGPSVAARPPVSQTPTSGGDG